MDTANALVEIYQNLSPTSYLGASIENRGAEMKGDSLVRSEFIDMMYSYNAIMLVNRPTRFPIGDQPGDPSIIDHFYTNDPQSIKDFGQAIFNNIV